MDGPPKIDTIPKNVSMLLSRSSSKYRSSRSRTESSVNSSNSVCSPAASKAANTSERSGGGASRYGVTSPAKRCNRTPKSRKACASFLLSFSISRSVRSVSFHIVKDVPSRKRLNDSASPW